MALAPSLKGYLYAALAAAAYGTNPIFAKPLYEKGMNPDSVLFFRYTIGFVLLAALMTARGLRTHSFRSLFFIEKYSAPQLLVLGLLMAVSSLTLFESYNYMAVGIASTLLFTYPILVALIMALCFHEHPSWLLIGCLAMASVGIALLCPTSTSTYPDFSLGFLLVALSSLSYAIYLIGLNKSRARTIASMPATWYVLLAGLLLFACRLLITSSFTAPTTPAMWLSLFGLGFLPTVVSLVLTAQAIRYIGSTKTALLGALEPVTALFLGAVILQESLSIKEMLGALCIFAAVTIVVSRRK